MTEKDLATCKRIAKKAFEERRFHDAANEYIAKFYIRQGIKKLAAKMIAVYYLDMMIKEKAHNVAIKNLGTIPTLDGQ